MPPLQTQFPVTFLSRISSGTRTLDERLTALGLTVWYAGDGETQPATITAAGDGQPVSLWGVEGTTDFDLTAEGTARPVYDLSVDALNGRGGVVFASANSQVLQRTVSASTFLNESTFNLFAVFVATGAGNKTFYAEGSTSSNAPKLMARVDGGNIRIQFNDSSGNDAVILTSGTSYLTTARILTLRRSGSDFELRIDGELVGTVQDELGNVPINRIAIGALVRAAVSNYFNGTIACVAHGGVDVYAAAESILSDHYDIPLFAEHVPFDSAAYGGTVNVNSIHIRDNAIASNDTHQAMAWWRPASTGGMALAVRSLGGDWQQYVYPQFGPDVDFHNVCNVGIDPDGYLHVAYNMHVDPLQYRRSTTPLASFDGILTAPLAMLGTNEARVTYPTFFNDPSGKLYFMFRDYGSGQGDLYFYAYDETTETWSAAAGTDTGGKLIDGLNSTGEESPYWDAPVFDDDFGSGGYMHLSWCWRDTASGTTNHDYCYMRWDGTNWTTIDGAAQTIPVTTANHDVFDPVASGGGLSNTNGIDADSDGHPHIAYWKDGGDGKAHLFHAWHNGVSWVITQLTSVGPTSFAEGHAYLDMGRPSVLIDRDTDTVHILFRNDADVDGILMFTSDPGDFTEWTQSVIHAEDVGYFEPNYDRERWLAEKKIVMQLAPWFDTEAASFDIEVFEYTP